MLLMSGIRENHYFLLFSETLKKKFGKTEIQGHFPKLLRVTVCSFRWSMDIYYVRRILIRVYRIIIKAVLYGIL